VVVNTDLVGTPPSLRIHHDGIQQVITGIRCLGALGQIGLTLTCLFCQGISLGAANQTIAIGNVMRAVLKARINPPIPNDGAGKGNGNGWTVLFLNIMHLAKNIVCDMRFSRKVEGALEGGVIFRQKLVGMEL
jgi:hypothetical protein